MTCTSLRLVVRRSTPITVSAVSATICRQSPCASIPAPCRRPKHSHSPHSLSTHDMHGNRPLLTVLATAPSGLPRNARRCAGIIENTAHCYGPSRCNHAGHPSRNRRAPSESQHNRQPVGFPTEIPAATWLRTIQRGLTVHVHGQAP